MLLIEYVARGPLSNERLQIIDNNKVKLRLKSKWVDGTTHILFTYSEFIEKLTALIPRPNMHLVRWSGALAPNSPYRKLITLNPAIKKGQLKPDIVHDEEFLSSIASEVINTITKFCWAIMLSKVFQIDVSSCGNCGGKMKIIAAITDQPSIKRYLKSTNIDYAPPARAPPKFAQLCFNF